MKPTPQQLQLKLIEALKLVNEVSEEMNTDDFRLCFFVDAVTDRLQSAIKRIVE